MRVVSMAFVTGSVSIFIATVIVACPILVIVASLKLISSGMSLMAFCAHETEKPAMTSNKDKTILLMP